MLETRRYQPQASHVLALLLLVLLLPTTPAHARSLRPLEAAQLGGTAFTYGYPLMEFLRVRQTATSVTCPDIYGNSPVNSFSNVGGFPRPQDRLVVAPNTDTLYSIAHLDLADGPVVLEHPDMASRYFVFQMLDPYTNTLGYIGSRTTGSAAGRFAITWSGAPGTAPADATPVEVPYRRIWIIGRTLATDSADQAVAKSLMKQFTLTPPAGPVAAAGCMPQTPTQAPQFHGIALLDEMSKAMEENPPPARDAAVLAQLAAIGVGPGLRVADANLSRAARASLDASVRWTERALPGLVEAQRYAFAFKNRGWASPDPSIGDYGTNYLFRAGVAQIGLGANTPEEAAYDTALLDNGWRPLDGSNTYRMRFAPGQEPPNGAFWSVTVYDNDGFLIPGAEGRHSVGPSHPPLKRRADGSVEIVFSQTEPTDPDVNWLPIPAGRFRVYLRTYVPGEAVLNRTWRPPSITRN